MCRCPLPRMGRDAVPSVTSPSTFVVLVVGDRTANHAKPAIQISAILHTFYMDSIRIKGVEYDRGTGSRLGSMVITKMWGVCGPAAKQRAGR
jgi:hypothetical protein